MNVEPTPEDDNAELEVGRQTDAMKAQLRKDVDAWSKERSDASAGSIAEPSLPASRQVRAKPPAKAKKVDAAPPAAKAADQRSKPFSMSYGGETTKAYMAYVISLGTR